MAQARALNAAEMEQVLEHVNAGRHAHRNRCFILLTHLAGMRVGEVASLRWIDVLTADGHIKEEIRLLPEMTKGKHARTVFISTRLREELQRYADIYRRSAPLECPLFYSQKDARKGFTANSLTQTVAKLYRGAGLDGATSHSGRRTFLTNLGKQRHSDSPAPHPCWTSQHQHNSHLSLQQPNPIKSGCGACLK